MAKVLILGGGFGGVIAAETLAKKLGNKHEIYGPTSRPIFNKVASGAGPSTNRKRTGKQSMLSIQT